MLQHQWVTRTMIVIVSNRLRGWHLQLYKLQGCSVAAGETKMEFIGSKVH